MKNLSISLFSLLLISLTLTNCKKKDKDEPAAPTAPTANFTIEQSIAGSNYVAIINNAILGGANYHFDFGDGSDTISSEQAIFHEYTALGTYTITLTASNTVGSNTLSKQVTVTQIFNDGSGGTDTSYMSPISNIGYGSMKVNFVTRSTGGYLQNSTSASFTEFNDVNLGVAVSSFDTYKDLDLLVPGSTYYVRIRNSDGTFTNVETASTLDVSGKTPTISVTDFSENKLNVNTTVDLGGELFLNISYTDQIAYDNGFTDLLTGLETTSNTFDPGNFYYRPLNTTVYIKSKAVVNTANTLETSVQTYTNSNRVVTTNGNFGNIVQASNNNKTIVIGSNAGTDYMEINLNTAPVQVGDEFVLTAATENVANNYIIRYKDGSKHLMHNNSNGFKLKVIEVKDGKFTFLLINGTEDAPFLAFQGISGFFGLMFTTR